ncbi:hypothetical protein GMJAKD_04835 [Candidatus Electrothrix aarhusensis]|jgi:predicted transposase YdaD
MLLRRQRQSLLNSLLNLNTNSLDTAFDEGKEEGIEVGIEAGKQIGREEGEERGNAANQREIVSRGLKQGLDIQIIADLTGLSAEAIENMQRKLSR